MVQRRKRIARSQRDELHAKGDEQRFGTDHQCIDPLFDKRREGRVDFSICAGGDNFDLPPDRGGRRVQFRDKGIGSKGIVGIDKHAKSRGARHQLVQEPESFWPKLDANVADPGRVAADASGKIL